MPTPTNQFRLKLRPSTPYNISIDWGDGDRTVYRQTTPSNASQAGVTHTYNSGGVKVVSITENVVGGFPQPYFDGVRNTDGNNDDTKVKKILQWGRGTYSNNFDFSFAGCTNLQITATDSDSSKLNLITNLDSAFFNCTTLNSFPTINTSNVTNFNSTWYNCVGLSNNFPLLNMNKMTTGFNCFFNVKLSTAIYDQLLQNLANNNLNTGVVFHAGQNTYYSPAAKPFRDILTNNRNWTITDGGMLNGLTLTKVGGTPALRDVFNFTTDPAGLTCGSGCTTTSVSYGFGTSVVLNYTATGGTTCALPNRPNVFYSTTRSVQYTYAAGNGISLVGNGILNTGELIVLAAESGLTIGGTPSDGAPYDYIINNTSNGIRIQYQDIGILMNGDISVTAQVRCD
jgi:hypothetical protein